ncbi:MAG: GNAT family N-acetyltransferase [Burkholderiales bacterium]
MNTRVKGTFDVSLVAEMVIDPAVEQDLARLLDLCFPETFNGRTYFKQLPHARLIHRQDGAIGGQVGLDYRVVRIASEVVRVLGIIDLCVAPELRHCGRASALLDSAAEIGADARVAFTNLFADKPDLYLRNGYRAVAPALITWLAIEDRSTCGIHERDFCGVLMARPVAGVDFPRGAIDLLGYLF